MRKRPQKATGVFSTNDVIDVARQEALGQFKTWIDAAGQEALGQFEKWIDNDTLSPRESIAFLAGARFERARLAQPENGKTHRLVVVLDFSPGLIESPEDAQEIRNAMLSNIRAELEEFVVPDAADERPADARKSRNPFGFPFNTHLN